MFHKLLILFSSFDFLITSFLWDFVFVMTCTLYLNPLWGKKQLEYLIKETDIFHFMLRGVNNCNIATVIRSLEINSDS